MAIGLAPSLPLGLDSRNGYSLHEEIIPMVLQNMKMVVLTNPGERTMNPRFGVGIRKYLFEPDNPVVYSDLKARIVAQVNDYMPFVQIEDIDFRSIGMGNNEMTPNYTNVSIRFRIVPLGTTETLEIEI